MLHSKNPLILPTSKSNPRDLFLLPGAPAFARNYISQDFPKKTWGAPLFAVFVCKGRVWAPSHLSRERAGAIAPRAVREKRRPRYFRPEIRPFAHLREAGANILSMDVIRKAQEIQKLAKSVQDKMRNAY